MDRRVLATLALAATCLAGCSDAGDASDSGGVDTLELVDTERASKRLLEFTLSTPALEEDVGVRVLLPRRYRDSRRRYPVLYLLHGAGGDEATWTAHGRATKLTRRRPLIVVMPDGGTTGFYTDWFNGGDGGPPMWETFHIDQLVPWIDSRFRTRSGRRERALAGVSMGGFGALSYAARHPDLFGTAASFSGAVDTTSDSLRASIEAVETDDGEPAIWGSYESEEERWRAYNPLDLAERLRSVRVLLFTGNGQPGGVYGGGPDPGEAVIEEMNIRLHARLDQLGIRHRFVDYGPGTHTLAYATGALNATLPLLMRAFGESKGRGKR